MGSLTDTASDIPMFHLVGIAILVILALQPGSLASSLDWKIQLAEGEQRLEAQDIEGAETCFRGALKEVRHNRDSSADEIACCMQALAGVLQMEDKTEDVIPLYKKSLHLIQSAHGKDNIKIVPTLILLGGIFESEGDYKLAVKFYSRALLLTENDSGEKSLAFADCQHRLGRAIFKEGLPRQAEELYQSALSAIMLQTGLPSNDVLAELLSDYIDLLRRSAEQGKALSSDFQTELLKDQLGALDKTTGVASSAWNKEVLGNLAAQAKAGAIDLSGVKDPSIATRSIVESKASSNDRANEINSIGALSGATEEERIFQPGLNKSATRLPTIEPDKIMSNSRTLEQINRQRVDFYERMIAIDIDSLGPDHPSVARDLSGLATIYLLQKKYDKAKPLLMRTLKIYQGVYSSDALLVRRTQSLLNLISEEQNTPEYESIPETDYLKSLPPIPLQAQKLEIALKLNYLAFLNYCHGRVQNAATIYAWALADSVLACGDESPIVASCLNDYSRVLRSSGKPEEAQKAEGRAHIILRRALAKQTALSMP